MACLLVQQPVTDFNEWKKVYDSAAGIRKQIGVRSDMVFQEYDNPKMVTVLFECETPKRVRQFAESPLLLEAVGQAGVHGLPSFSFLNEV